MKKGALQISELSDPSSERFILLTGYSGMMLSLADEAKSCKEKGLKQQMGNGEMKESEVTQVQGGENTFQ